VLVSLCRAPPQLSLPLQHAYPPSRRYRTTNEPLPYPWQRHSVFCHLFQLLIPQKQHEGRWRRSIQFLLRPLQKNCGTLVAVQYAQCRYLSVHRKRDAWVVCLVCCRRLRICHGGLVLSGLFPNFLYFNVVFLELLLGSHFGNAQLWGSTRLK
jgi:hypothetical protein